MHFWNGAFLEYLFPADHDQRQHTPVGKFTFSIQMRALPFLLSCLPVQSMQASTRTPHSRGRWGLGRVDSKLTLQTAPRDVSHVLSHKFDCPKRRLSTLRPRPIWPPTKLSFSWRWRSPYKSCFACRFDGYSYSFLQSGGSSQCLLFGAAWRNVMVGQTHRLLS